jgi:type IV pilus assembly protein PilP
MNRFRVTLLPAGLLLLTLAGCGDDGVPEVRQWMAEVRQQTRVVTPKLAAPKKFTPFTYDAAGQIDPYSQQKMAAAFAKLEPAAGNGLKPNFERRREPLESYPLDALRMVGSLERGGQHYALLQVDKSVLRARVGNYIGQNFGVITRITDSAIELKETVQDASGEWIERPAKLELQETTK